MTNRAVPQIVAGRLGSVKLERKRGASTSRLRVILIVLDGERTEYQYFLGWRRFLGHKGVVLVTPVVSSGGNVLKAVKETIRISKKDRDYDEIWCVCDADDTSVDEIISARRLAEKHRINLCLSTRCFEIWLALHWAKISLSPISKSREAIALVQKYYPCFNERKKHVPFSVLQPLTVQACENARWLVAQNLDNPTTNVHELIDILISVR
jgi:hypothetical protein